MLHIDIVEEKMMDSCSLMLCLEVYPVAQEDKAK